MAVRQDSAFGEKLEEMHDQLHEFQQNLESEISAEVGNSLGLAVVHLGDAKRARGENEQRESIELCLNHLNVIKSEFIEEPEFSQVYETLLHIQCESEN